MFINEVCKECGLTKKAIEYYGGQGLISPAVMGNGYRRFSANDVSKLKRIAVLRGLGLSVADIRVILGNGGMSMAYGILNKKELEIANLQAKQALLSKLAAEEDWDTIREQLDAIQKKRSILDRMLDKFPGYYGKLVYSHFSPFLSELIITDEQQAAFETIINFLDDVHIIIPEDLQEHLDEAVKNTDAAVIQNAASALAAAMENPEQYISDNKELIEQYQAVMDSDEYKTTPMYRLHELLKRLQRENGYNDIFIPAMKRLSPSYREYYKALEAANDIFMKNYPVES